MIDPKSRTTHAAAISAQGAATGVTDATVMRCLAKDDAASLAVLEAWLKTHARTFLPIVSSAIQDGQALSPEAAGVLLNTLAMRAPVSGEATLRLLARCLSTVASRLTESLNTVPPRAISDEDDVLVTYAVATLTSNRPARYSETAIRSLSEAGPGGALVLTRAFNAARAGLKMRIVRRLSPVDVMVLDDNVVVSLSHSVSSFADGLEGPDKAVALRFLAELGSVLDTRTSRIEVTEPLEAGDCVFHASWGSGTVIIANDESATIDFGGAGTRTLLRGLTTLRRS